MRYHHTSWNDVDRALEAFRYARRLLLVVMTVALPFAAWDAAFAPAVAVEDAAPVRTVKQITPQEQARLVGEALAEEGCGASRTVETRVRDAAV